MVLFGVERDVAGADLAERLVVVDGEHLDEELPADEVEPDAADGGALAGAFDAELEGGEAAFVYEAGDEDVAVDSVEVGAQFRERDFLMLTSHFFVRMFRDSGRWNKKRFA